MEHGPITLGKEQSAKLLGWGIRFFLAAALTASQTPGGYAPFALGLVAAVRISTPTAKKGRALAKSRNSSAPSPAPARAAAPFIPGPAAATSPSAKGA